MANDKKLHRFSKGIHIEKLEKEDLKFILSDYYNIEISYKRNYNIEFVHEGNHKNKSVLKQIYFNALSAILWSGYHIPVSRFKYLLPVDPYLYYDDMVMMLYLYIKNLDPPITANELGISTGTQTELNTIEQSGFGTILGIRRKNVSYDLDVNEIQNYENSKSILPQIAPYNPNVEDAAQNTSQFVIRCDHETKYSIPVICENVVIALVRSRKYNPFLFALFDKESKDEAISLSSQLKDSLLQMLDENPVKIKEDPLTNIPIEIQEIFTNFESISDLTSSDLDNFKNDEDYDRFCRQYKEKWDEVFEKNESIENLKKSDLQLLGLLFINKYYVNTIRLLIKKFTPTSISEKVINQVMDTVHNVSESFNKRNAKIIEKIKENPLTIFSKKIQDSFAAFESFGDLTSSNLNNFLIDNNFEEYDRFYRQYYSKLDKPFKESNKEENSKELHLKEADLYLSELLFANNYNADIIKQLKKELVKASISENTIEQIMDTFYNVSESMLCFSRKKHAELYLDILFNRKGIEKEIRKNKTENDKEATEKKLLKLLKKMNKTENYIRKKFAPALFYCFLYYVIDKITTEKNFSMDKLLSILENEIKGFNEILKLPPEMKLKNVFSDENMKSLLFKRKRRFLAPLKYSMEKALF